ncbi:MAG: FG-GAP-like repeat-containing protein [Promethearchaeota archaeon]
MKIKKVWEFNAKEQLLGLELGFLLEQNIKLLITYSKSGKLWIFNLEGLRLYDDNITQNSPIWCCKFFDIDDDGNYELLLGGLDGLLRVFKLNPDFSLKFYWAHQFGSSISGFFIDDINNDGKVEIVAYSLDKSLRIINPVDGSLIWGQVFEEGIGEAILWRNSNNPKDIEIIACGNDGTVRIFNANNGELIWFKKFTDKVRCISYIRSIHDKYIICGGDDKLIHIIDKRKREEIKTIAMNNVVWKSISFPPDRNNFIIISSYSFDFLIDSIPIEDIEFQSKVVCLNEYLNIIWEKKNINSELLKYIQTPKQNFIGIGTTKGRFLIINEKSGEILAQINNKFSINDFEFISESNQLILCHDNGYIYSYNIS